MTLSHEFPQLEKRLCDYDYNVIIDEQPEMFLNPGKINVINGVDVIYVGGIFKVLHPAIQEFILLSLIERKRMSQKRMAVF